MTAIAGYIYRNTVQIIADSAETTVRPDIPADIIPLEIKTSFFESPDNADGKFSIETAHKIYNIENRMILAYAGSVAEGDRAIEDIQIQQALYPSLLDFCQRFFSGASYRLTQYIIGFIENDKPYMFIYYNPTDFHVANQPYSLARAGLNIGNDSEHLLGMIIDAESKNYSPHDQLVQMVSIYQKSVVTQRSIRDGVGGHINGAFIDNSGVHWAKDTAHIMYSGHNFDRGEQLVVFRFNRDGATFTLRKGYNQVFTNDLTDLSKKQLIAKWGEKLKEYVRTWAADYFVFFGYDIDTLIVLNATNTSHIKVEIENKNLRLPDTVREWMFRYIPEKDNTRVTFVETNFVTEP